MSQLHETRLFFQYQMVREKDDSLAGDADRFSLVGFCTTATNDGTIVREWRGDLTATLDATLISALEQVAQAAQAQVMSDFGITQADLDEGHDYVINNPPAQTALTEVPRG